MSLKCTKISRKCIHFLENLQWLLNLLIQTMSGDFVPEPSQSNLESLGLEQSHDIEVVTIAKA